MSVIEVNVFDLEQADSPLVISVPHDGALIPDDILATMNPVVLDSSDRDFLINEVFDFEGLACTKIKANYSRHVIDLNRPASGEALYSGQTETELCPTSTFDCKPIYINQSPSADEINRRIELYWQPYHNQLSQLILAAKNKFGFCLLIDAHSINDQVPRFFAGSLPDINVGTYAGKSCSSAVEQFFQHVLQQQKQFSYVLNGRFKGGFITRNYGDPDNHIHAVQLEHAKSCYLDNQLNLSAQSERLRQFWFELINNLLKSMNF